MLTLFGFQRPRLRFFKLTANSQIYASLLMRQIIFFLYPNDF